MAKITPRSQDGTVVVRTHTDKTLPKPGAWWNYGSKKELCDRVLASFNILKEQSQYRYRQDALYARLYGNMPLYGSLGASLTRIASKNQLPTDRPTMSVITSCTDTIVSKLSQNKPHPIYLTDNGNYKQRNLAKQMNSFINGELYQTKAYQLGSDCLRDSCVWGTGAIKVLETNKKVSLERRLRTQLLVDPNEAFFNAPRQLFEMKLVDRDVLMETFPNYASMISRAEQAYPEGSSDSTKTISDQVMVVESWHLPSGPGSKDGVHAIVCSEGVIGDDSYYKERFPFAFLNYSPPQVGFWGQGIAERLMGTQSGINQLLMTIHSAINLVGVPRVFVEDGSKIVKAQLNNQVGAIVTYRGTKPIYEVAPCVPVELYQQLERLIQFAYNQEGISELAAVGKKPAGLNSGEAQREYDDIQSERFAALSKRYEDFYIDLSYLIIDKAIDIAERDGKYQTVYPSKDGTKQIDLPEIGKLKDDPFVIECYDMSSLPRDPAGRAQKIIEYMQSGLYTPQEGRRLLGFPDTQQEDKLLNAAEERILKTLDKIIEDGEYTPPDPFMDLAQAETIVVQYINMYSTIKLEEEKMQLLRNFFSQIQSLKAQAMSAMAPQPGAPGQAPQAAPAPQPQSEMIPNVPGVQ